MSFHSKSITDLRGGVEMRRSSSIPSESDRMPERNIEALSIADGGDRRTAKAVADSASVRFVEIRRGRMRGGGLPQFQMAARRCAASTTPLGGRSH